MRRTCAAWSGLEAVGWVAESAAQALIDDTNQQGARRVAAARDADTFEQNEKRGLLMAAEKSQNVQDVFLNHIRKHKVPVTVFLVNGVKLQGIVTWFDNFCVLLRRDAHSQLVYKHAISTVMPASPISLFEGQKEEAEA